MAGTKQSLNIGVPVEATRMIKKQYPAQTGKVLNINLTSRQTLAKLRNLLPVTKEADSRIRESLTPKLQKDLGYGF